MEKQLVDVQAAHERLRKEHAVALKKKEDELKRLSETFEVESEGSNLFWKTIAKTSACETLGDTVDLNELEVLGNGNYGFVLKSKRLQGGQPVVIKLMSTRWSHVAAREWHYGQIVSDCPQMLGCDDCVLLHLDKEKHIRNLLQAAQEAGSIHLKTKRTGFPDRFVCLFQDFMNFQTVQHHMDDDRLDPGGMLMIMQRVASGLAYMHKTGLTHNDVKPANVILSKRSGAVVARLGDLGLVQRSVNRTSDFALYGMTVLCMLTKEPFGKRKFVPELVEALVAEAVALVEARRELSSGEDAISSALAEVPIILERIWQMNLRMVDVAELPCLQGWTFEGVLGSR
jgi:hypothetical protein